MSFGENLQFLRKLRNKMTQEELAEKLQVSRQTISKWEGNLAYPEIDKAVALCDLFCCTMDNLFREDLSDCEESFSDIRTEYVDGFRYIRYAVISREPEADAISRVKLFAENYHIREPQIIGWDFPFVSQEQANVFHMHGYTAALVLPSDMDLSESGAEVVAQDRQQYVAITIKDPFQAAFRVIPNAYKTLMSYISLNGWKLKEEDKIIQCFEKVYSAEGVTYMDVFIAIE